MVLRVAYGGRARWDVGGGGFISPWGWWEWTTASLQECHGVVRCGAVLVGGVQWCANGVW